MTEHDWTNAHFETRAIHAGQEADPTTGAVTPPIYQTSTFVLKGLEHEIGYVYARVDNPTRTALQTALASLEGAQWALSYASGLAAAQNVFSLLRPGDHVLMSNDAYGGTNRLLVEVISPIGIEFDLVDLSDPGAVRAAMRPQTRLIWAETPTNPYLKIVDIAAIAAIAHAGGALLAVDNTFASPYLQQPLALGADIVMHSVTKYLGGHSDVIAGALAGNDEELGARLKVLQTAGGAVPSPFDCWLVLRGIKTLPVRMDRHCANARAVAEFLSGQQLIEQVFYPGLPSHPGHEVAARQMKDFSGMVSFTVRGGYEAARCLVESTSCFQLAVSLGGVESLIEHPGQLTHLSVAGTEAEVADNLIRLSVGIEHIDDLIADLETAIAAVNAALSLGV